MKTKFTYCLITTILLLVNYQQSFAEGVGPGFTLPSASGFRLAPGSRTFYVYAKAGEKIYWTLNKLAQNSSATGADHKVTVKIYSPLNDYTPNSKTPTSIAANLATATIANFGLTGQTSADIIVVTAANAGIWSFVISQGITQDKYSSGDNSRFSFDVSAKAGNAASAEIPGRVYLENLRISQATALTFPLFSLDQFGYQYKTTLNNITPIDIEFVIDNVGNTLKGTATPAYKSFSSANSDASTYGNTSIESIYDNTITNVPDKAKIFLNQPDAAMPTSAAIWNIATAKSVTEWLVQSAPLPASVASLVLTPDVAGVPAKGNFSFTVTNYKGSATLYIDANNNGVYTDAVDRIVPITVTAGNNVIAFDGKDGSGNFLGCKQVFNAKVVLEKIAEIHFVLWDAEGLGGIKIERLNGANLPSSAISWDDNLIQAAGGKTTTTPQVTGTKVTSATATGIHGWDNSATGGWGNDAYIDNWSFLPDVVTVSASLTAGTSSDYGDLDATKWPVAAARVGTCTFTNNAPATTGTDIAVWAGKQISTETATTSGGNSNASTDNFDDGLTMPSGGYVPNTSNNFTVSLNANRNNKTVFYALWFDWDADGTFDFAATGSGVVTTALTPVSIISSVAIPKIVNSSFKVRLIISDVAVPALTNSALNIASGEIEDYIAPPLKILPITLTQFTATENGKATQLTWVTETEINNTGFTIQRSSDGIRWLAIGFKASQAVNANSSIKLNYTFTDANPLPGVNYYKLQQTDINGTTTYSDIRLVDFKNTAQLLVYPTLASDGKVNVRGLKGTGVIKVFNSNGALLSQINVKNTTAQIDLSNYNKGLYLLNITDSNDNSSTFKVIY